MRLILTVIFFLMLGDKVYAISPTTIDVIKEAQYYGQMHMHSQLNDFLRPWISYEEKADRLNETAEHAYLYTPFLLIATDAREKGLNGQKIELLDGKRIVNDYAGTLSFSVVLFGTESEFGRNATVMLKQGEKVITPYQVAIPLNAEKTTRYSKKSAYKIQCYFYFFDKKVDFDKPMILSIVTGDKKEHHFYFVTTNVK